MIKFAENNTLFYFFLMVPLYTLHFLEIVSIIRNSWFVASLFWGCSKMFRCKARKKPNREAYLRIR